VQDLFLDEELEGQARDGCGGKEVTEVPLCAACVVEVEVDGVTDQNVVVKRGLRRVEKVDGGLTRKRWEANTSEKGSKVSIELLSIAIPTDTERVSLSPLGNHQDRILKVV
jgi:hypothetical protein